MKVDCITTGFIAENNKIILKGCYTLSEAVQFTERHITIPGATEEHLRACMNDTGNNTVKSALMQKYVYQYPYIIELGHEIAFLNEMLEQLTTLISTKQTEYINEIKEIATGKKVHNV